MARTIRRKHYTPHWVTQDTYEFIDPNAGCHVWAGVIDLEGAARSAQLRLWHKDGLHGHIMQTGSAPKGVRQEVEQQHRMHSQREISQWKRDPSHEVQLPDQRRLSYWN